MKLAGHLPPSPQGFGPLDGDQHSPRPPDLKIGSGDLECEGCIRKENDHVQGEKYKIIQDETSCIYLFYYADLIINSTLNL